MVQVIANKQEPLEGRATMADYLCSETSDISTSKNESLLRSGSLNDRAYLSGIWQRANVTVCSEEENSCVEVGGEGADEEISCGSVMVFPTKRGNM